MKAKFTLVKDCKHSRRFQSTEKEFPIRDVYVMRPWADKKVGFILEIKEENSSKG